MRLMKELTYKYVQEIDDNVELIVELCKNGSNYMNLKTQKKLLKI